MKETRTFDYQKFRLIVQMTQQFDEFRGELMGRQLPVDLPDEAVAHISAPTRTTKQMPNGESRGVWIKGKCHYTDAAIYAREGRLLMHQAGIAMPKEPPFVSVTSPSKWSFRRTR